MPSNLLDGEAPFQALGQALVPPRSSGASYFSQATRFVSRGVVYEVAYLEADAIASNFDGNAQAES